MSTAQSRPAFPVWTARGAAPSLDAARTHRTRGRVGCLLLVGLIALGWFAPLLASDQPVICSYRGSWYCPALIQALGNLPLLGRWATPSPPFGHPDFDARTAPDGLAWGFWPVIPYSPTELADRALLRPSRWHWLGTDDRGRDVAARLLHGATVSVQVGLMSTLLAGLIGVLVGAAAGYLGGWTDRILSRCIEMVMCFPTLFLILAVLAWLRPGTGAVILVIGLTRWTSVARFVRAEVLRLQTAEFVLAARALGASSWRILTRHILPLALAPVGVTLIFGVADAILIEAGLSWLGLGVPSPQPSWGAMLRNAYDQMRSADYLLYPPCVAVFISVLACHLAADGLRASLDRRADLAG